MQDFIKWREDWLLGIEILDAQHLGLADCLNRLVRECSRINESENTDDAERLDVLKSLTDELYLKTKEHFKDEEALMLSEEYPGYTSHAREHVMLLAELKSTFDPRLKEGCKNIDPEILNDLKYWFVAHVSCSDQEFADYLLMKENPDHNSN